MNPTGHQYNTTPCACVVKSLADAALRGPLVGLKLNEDDALELDQNSFPCCYGEGVRVTGAWEMSQCDLRGRLGKVGRIWAQMVSMYGRANALEALKRLSIEQEMRMMTHLKGLAQGTEKRGIAVPGMTLQVAPATLSGATTRANGHEGTGADGQRGLDGKRAPSTLWLIALAAAWRFGINCHMVGWNVGTRAQWLPRDEFWQAKGPHMMVVTDVSQLWDPARAFDFEWLVGYAYQAELPVWFEFLGGGRDPVGDAAENAQLRSDSDSSDSRGGRRGRAFASMIATTKKQSAIQWLAGNMRGKLEEVCDLDFFEASLTAAIGNQKATNTGASTKLPRTQRDLHEKDRTK